VLDIGRPVEYDRGCAQQDFAPPTVGATLGGWALEIGTVAPIHAAMHGNAPGSGQDLAGETAE
jgi:hypothetical protein